MNPDERFTVYEWKKYAEQKIYEIRMRGKYPIIVGGTGLYIDALIYDYQFNQKERVINLIEKKSEKIFGLVGAVE